MARKHGSFPAAFAVALALGACMPIDESCLGKYPMSFFKKARSANMVGARRLSTAIKVDDTVPNKTLSVLCVKYGWNADHHMAVGVPYADSDTGNSGVTNPFIFEKWRIARESLTTPAVAVDLWYYFSSNDAGPSESAVKATAEISKAWNQFSIHLNPGYLFRDGADMSEMNGAFLWKANRKLWPGIEFNYSDHETKGYSSDIIPGVIWKWHKCGSAKLGISTDHDADGVGLVGKLFYKW